MLLAWSENDLQAVVLAVAGEHKIAPVEGKDRVDAFSLRKACHRSQSCCKPSQKSADIPSTCASRSAVSGVTPRLPRIISFKRGKEIPRRTAKADWLIPSGLRNSSSSISPGCVGGRLAGSRRATRSCDDLPRRGRPLVVVCDLNLVGILILPAKAHAILLVNANAVLANTIPT